MATQTSIFTPGPDHEFTVTTNNNGAPQAYHTNGLLAMNANGDMNVVFYSSKTASPPIPAGTNFRIPSGVVATYDMGQYYDTFSVFNPSASANMTVWWQELQRN